MSNEIIRVVFLGGFVDTTDSYQTVLDKINKFSEWADFECRDGSKHHLRIKDIIDVWRLEDTNPQQQN